MADDLNISYSYQTGSQTPASEPASTASVDATTKLYAFVDCERVSLPNGGVLLIHKLSDRQMVVAHEVSTALQSCNIFRTLAKHVEVLTTTIPQLAGQQEDVAQVLGMVKDAGLLTTAESVCERISPQQLPTTATLPPTRVFLITCDRPPAVQRLLQSMLMAGNLSRHEQLFLIDDSRDPQNAELNREMVEKFNLNSPRDMQYVGAKQQEYLLNTLVAELPDQEAGIHFLIDRQRWAEHKSYGLARTLCLLLSVDSRAIVMDDDVICAAVASPHKRTGLAFGDMGREVEFYTSEQDILARTAKAEFDPLTGHAQCLGLSMAQAISKLGVCELQAKDLQEANATYISQWHADSPVLITQSGTMGDPGTPGTEWVYTIDPASTKLQNRHYWMGQPRPIFSKMAVISQVTGLDNSHLLPPYFPVFRGEDYLFGAMVEYLHPQAATLEYDWCVPHFPLDARSGTADNKPATGKGGINPSKYITDHTLYEPGISAETRINSLTQLLKELSQTSDQGLLTRYRTEVAEAQGAQVKRLTAKLEDGTSRPEDWQAYLQQSLKNTSEAMSSTARLEDIPGIPDGYGAQQILDEFRAYTGEFALALEGWSNMREAAKNVTAEMLSTGMLAP
jgi:hypothetical protein